MNTQAIDEEFRRLVDEHRTACLWFLKADYYPITAAARLRVLDYIQRHGNRDAYVRAGGLRQWLLHPSSERSAAD